MAAPESLGNGRKAATDQLFALKILEEVQGALDVEEIRHVYSPSHSYFLRENFSALRLTECALAHITPAPQTGMTWR